MNAPNAPTLLVVDEDAGAIGEVDRLARGRGFDVVARRSDTGILEELPTLKPDVAFVELKMPEIAGLDVVRAIREVHPACEVVLTTGHASVGSAIEAVKSGALDYVGKPFDFERVGGLLDTVRHAIDRRARLMEADSELASELEFHGLIGRSPVMQELFDKVLRLAPHVSTALVSGEPGTGKELVARALHSLGGRRSGPFIPCNCSAISGTLFEAELLGDAGVASGRRAEPRIGLFEHADGGTLFLDEIAAVPLTTQAYLLRALDRGEVTRVGASETTHVDVHVVATTTRQLGAEVAAGRFRQDLYHRLHVVEFRVPALRERRDDITFLTAAFATEFSDRFGKTIAGVSPRAERLLQSAPWPGNVRELRDVLERACIASNGRILTESDVVQALGGPQALSASGLLSSGRDLAGGPSLAEVTRDRIEQVLQQVRGNRSAAARMLGISRRALYRRLDSFGLR